MEIHYINLDRSSGRRSFMEAQFDRMNLTFSRVPAVDGSQLTSKELDSVDRRDPRSEVLSDGEIGCFLSHRAAWALIADGPGQYGVVMEDDVYLSERSAYFLRNHAWIPEGTPIIRLETTFVSVLLGKSAWTRRVAGHRFKLRRCEINRIDGYEGGYGCGCYIVHRKYAAWLTRQFSRFSWHVDAEIYRAENFGRASTGAMNGAPLQLVPAVAVQQLCLAETFLPPDAEISILKHRHRARRNHIAGSVGPKKKIVRELKRAFSSSHMKRQMFGRRVPLLK